MAKPVIKFSAVAYDIGGKQGYRPQLESQGGIYDLDFCTEVVNEKRLAMSPDELYHAMLMCGEVAAKKVALDGRPRGITRLIKWNRFAKGKLESPSSPWNNTCKAVIRPQLLTEAEHVLDATFVNVTEGIGVNLANVTWIGAKSVLNVLKIGADFAANGNHMEFIAGDSAALIFEETEYALVCKESDVARAVFAFPTELAHLEAGTQVQFVMKSRGGIEGGQVYTSKKTVTIIGGDTPTIPEPKFTKVTCGAGDGYVPDIGSFELIGENLDCFTVGDKLKMDVTSGSGEKSVMEAEITSVNAAELEVKNPEGLEAGSTVIYSASIAGYTPEVEANVMGI